MSHSPSRAWSKLYRLKHAADDGMLIGCWCAYCRIKTFYIAADLLKVYSGEIEVAEFGRRCPKCGLDSWTRTKEEYPGPQHIGVPVRRPVEPVTVWRWETVLYMR